MPCGFASRAARARDRVVSLLNLPNNHKHIQEGGANMLIQCWIGHLRSNTHKLDAEKRPERR